LHDNPFLFHVSPNKHKSSNSMSSEAGMTSDPKTQLSPSDCHRANGSDASQQHKPTNELISQPALDEGISKHWGSMPIDEPSPITELLSEE